MAAARAANPMTSSAAAGLAVRSLAKRRPPPPSTTVGSASSVSTLWGTELGFEGGPHARRRPPSCRRNPSSLLHPYSIPTFRDCSVRRGCWSQACNNANVLVEVNGRVVGVTRCNGLDGPSRSHNPEVAGSNPAPATNSSFYFLL